MTKYKHIAPRNEEKASRTQQKVYVCKYCNAIFEKDNVTPWVCPHCTRETMNKTLEFRYAVWIPHKEKWWHKLLPFLRGGHWLLTRKKPWKEQ